MPNLCMHSAYRSRVITPKLPMIIHSPQTAGSSYCRQTATEVHGQGCCWLPAANLSWKQAAKALLWCDPTNCPTPTATVQPDILQGQPKQAAAPEQNAAFLPPSSSSVQSCIQWLLCRHHLLLGTEELAHLCLPLAPLALSWWSCKVLFHHCLSGTIHSLQVAGSSGARQQGSMQQEEWCQPSAKQWLSVCAMQLTHAGSHCAWVLLATKI